MTAPALLSARDVSVSRGGRTLLHGAGLDLHAGEVLGLIGPNGAGKSTLVRVLAGLDRPDAGRIELLGHPLNSWPLRERARHLGYLPQHFAPHWDLRVDELLRLGLDRAAGGARPAGLAALAAAHGLEALLPRRWSVLSGGERARALAASVLAPDPNVLLADEPAAALDVGQATALMHRLRGRRGGAVVVVHDLQLAARHCDHLVLMRAGAVVATGPAEEVLLGPVLDEAYGVTFRRLRGPDGRLVLTTDD